MDNDSSDVDRLMTVLPGIVERARVARRMSVG
jgi:hypothetical protein